MRILIAEDDEPKCFRLREFVEQAFVDVDVVIRRSVTTALSLLRDDLPDLVLLDMSLPTYEIAPGERGGRPQDFGGLTIMDFMDFEEISCPVIVVTQYETFPVGNGENMSIEAMAAKAAAEHERLFFGLVYYNSVESAWQGTLSALISKVMEHGGRA